MQKILLSLAFSFLFISSYSQSKPKLPQDFFDNFSYTLPAGFNYNDSAQLTTEVTKIAADLLKLNSDAENNYSISDPSYLYFVLDASATLNSISGNHQLAINAVKKVRILRPSPNYVIPYGLSLIAYTNSSLLHKDDGSDAFREILSKNILLQYNQIDPDFRNDITNQSKGSFREATIQINWNNLIRVFDQTVKNNNGKLNYDNAYSVLTLFQAYNLRKHYQPLIEKALYTISPAKVKEENIKIPMRDGIKLNGYIYKDLANTGKLPAIISLSPYPGGNEATRGNVFATNGYIFVYVDTRGRRESEGNFIPFENDAQDYYDIIDWVSKQAWCDGKVATSGGSYLGFDQWQAIRNQYKHPALRAINPIVSVGFGVDFPRKGNMFYTYILRWAAYVSGKDLNLALFRDWEFWDAKGYELYKKRLPFSKLDSVAGMPNPVFQKWINHPDFDTYWQNILPAKTDYEAIDIPILSITGYYDVDQVGAMYYYDQHQKYGTPKAKDDHYLLIGPYDHGGSQWQPSNTQFGMTIEKEAQIPIYKYVIWWFDWVLKGKQKPAFIKDKITYFETGNNIWKGTASLDKLATDSLEFFLSADRTPNARRKDLYSLNLKKSPENKTLRYSHDIAMAIDSASLFAFSKPFDDSIYMSSSHNMVFESQPLQKDILISNKIISRIYASLNVPDADFEISVHEISANGETREFGIGRIRARYRNSDEIPELVKPGEIVLLNFQDINIYIKKITKGTKLRLVFRIINDPWSEKNFGFGGVVSIESTVQPRIIEATLLVGGKNASKLVLPIMSE